MAKSYMVEQMARCERCGACCRHSILEADVADAIREPALWDKGIVFNGRSTIEDEAEWCINLNGSHGDNACVFLDGGHCTIYATRPQMCVATFPGSPRCTSSRLNEQREAIPLVDDMKDADWQ